MMVASLAGSPSAVANGLTVHYGRDGKDGARGPTGSRGLPGVRGHPGTPGPPGPNSGGVVYTRWGKHSCRYGAAVVYYGIMAGSSHHRKGGSVNRLCMPRDPQYTLPFIHGVQSYSPLYPVEYQDTIRNDGHDIPCAVCMVPDKNLVLMIPAKTSCPSGFTREYYGYVMSERVHENHHRSMFECVDKALEFVRGSKGHKWAAGQFGHVEAVCNALPCPPYNDYKELNCAVCTK